MAEGRSGNAGRFRGVVPSRWGRADWQPLERHRAGAVARDRTVQEVG